MKEFSYGRAWPISVDKDVLPDLYYLYVIGVSFPEDGIFALLS